MRFGLLAAPLLLTACLTVEPSFDAGLVQCADATAGVFCLRGTVDACDPADRVLEECERTPPCGCACPPGYVPAPECTGRRGLTP